MSKLYHRFDGRNASTATVAIALVQTLYLVEPGLFVWLKFVEVDKRMEQRGTVVFVAIALLTVLFIFNNRRYQRMFDEIYRRFETEDPKFKPIRLIAVIVVFMVPIILPMVVLSRG